MAKHHGWFGRVMTRALVVTGLALRAAGSGLAGDGENFRTYGRVLRSALGGWKTAA